jgi:hypothetical protein
MQSASRRSCHPARARSARAGTQGQKLDPALSLSKGGWDAPSVAARFDKLTTGAESLLLCPGYFAARNSGMTAGEEAADGR